jgi:cell division protein FtsN
VSSRQRISARDYKHGGRRGGFDLGRYRQFGFGLATGIAVTAAVFVFVFDHRGRPAEANVVQVQPQKKAASAPGNEAEVPEEQYDYYDMLSKFEVVLPEERDVRRDQPAAITEAGAYMIQAGSFTSENDALRRQQVLAKLGIEAAVQRVAIDADVRHRLRIGPISDLARLNAVRNQLRTADIEILLSRLPD